MFKTTKRFGMSRMEWRNQLLGLLFVSPWIIGFVLFTLIPILASLYYSFTRYDLLRDPVWVGVDNYVNLITDDSDFRIVVRNTLWWVVFSAPLGVLSAFLMALLLNTKIVGRSVYRAIFFFP